MSEAVLLALWEEVKGKIEGAEAAEEEQLYAQFLEASGGWADNERVQALRLEALAKRGSLLTFLGQTEAALAVHRQQYDEAGTTYHAVRALTAIGNQLNQLGRHDEALPALKEALGLAETLNDTAGRAEALGGLGSLHHHMGKTEEGIHYLNQALALAQQTGDVDEQIRNLIRIGFGRYYLGQVDRSIKAFRKGLGLAREHEVMARIAHILNNLGECHQMLYDLETAVQYHQEGLEIAEKMNARLLQGDLCRNLGIDYLRLGREDEGLPYLKKALVISEETHNADIRLQVLYALALAEIGRGESEAGKGYIEVLEEVAEAQQWLGYKADAMHAWGRYHVAQGAVAEAAAVWQEAVFVAHEAERRQLLLWQLHVDLAEVVTNVDLAAAHRRLAAEVVDQIAYPLQDKGLRQKFLSAEPIAALMEVAGR